MDFEEDILELNTILENHVKRPNIKMLIGAFIEKLKIEKKNAEMILSSVSKDSEKKPKAIKDKN